MTTTTTITNENKYYLLEHEQIGKYEYFHYIVKSLKSADHNAEHEIPEDFHITDEYEVSGIQYTRYASDYGSGDRIAVKTVNPNFGVEVSFYEPNGEQTDFLFKIF